MADSNIPATAGTKTRRRRITGRTQIIAKRYAFPANVKRRILSLQIIVISLIGLNPLVM